MTTTQEAWKAVADAFEQIRGELREKAPSPDSPIVLNPAEKESAWLRLAEPLVAFSAAAREEGVDPATFINAQRRGGDVPLYETFQRLSQMLGHSLDSVL